jgi:hypothetical protein
MESNIRERERGILKELAVAINFNGIYDVRLSHAQKDTLLSLLVALVVWHLIQCIIIKTMNEIE